MEKIDYAKKYCEKYYGDKKIKFVVDCDEKTYKGKEMIRLTFENDESLNIPVDIAEYAITETKSDLTTLRDVLVKPVVKEIMEILLESRLKIEDFEYIFNKVRGSVGESVMKAQNKLWKKDVNFLTLVDVDKILTDKKHE